MEDRWAALDVSMQSDDFNLLRSIGSDDGVMLVEEGQTSSSLTRVLQSRGGGDGNPQAQALDNSLVNKDHCAHDKNESMRERDSGQRQHSGFGGMVADPHPQSKQPWFRQHQEKHEFKVGDENLDSNQQSESEDEDDSSSSESESENAIQGSSHQRVLYQTKPSSGEITQTISFGQVQSLEYNRRTSNSRTGNVRHVTPEEDGESGDDSGETDSGEVYIKMFMDIMQERFSLVNQHCDMSMEPLTFNRSHKMWFDGTDCLDYVVTYGTKGVPEENVPDHWHYVSFGLSDTRGHGLQIPHTWGNKGLKSDKSGAGFELTIRVKASLTEPPPFWPVELLHNIAKYIYTANSIIVPGDHIAWHSPLNNEPSCLLKHMLITVDPTIPTIRTMTGSVAHYQIVGVMLEELQETQRWNALALLKLFEREYCLGGKYLVTDVNRKMGVHQIVPGVSDLVTDGMIRDGSDLTGVSCRAIWTYSPWIVLNPEKFWDLCEEDRKKYAEFFEVANVPIEGQVEELERLLSLTSFKQNADEDNPKNDSCGRLGSQNEDNDTESESDDVDDDLLVLRKLHLTLNSDAALMVATAFMGRVDHRRHFTFNDTILKDAVTFVPRGMEGSFTSDKRPFAARGPWIHVQLTDEARSKIINDLKTFFDTKPKFPKFFVWPEANFSMTVIDHSCF